MFQDNLPHPADSNQSKKRAVSDVKRIEVLGNQDVVPVVRAVAVLHQMLHFRGFQRPPMRWRLGDLLVPQVIFVLVPG